MKDMDPMERLAVSAARYELKRRVVGLMRGMDNDSLLALWQHRKEPSKKSRFLIQDLQTEMTKNQRPKA